MRALFAFISLAIAVAPLPAQDRAGNSGEAAIRELVRRYVDARERIDPQVLDRTRPESWNSGNSQDASRGRRSA